jgi:hypothetical protein
VPIVAAGMTVDARAALSIVGTEFVISEVFVRNIFGEAMYAAI